MRITGNETSNFTAHLLVALPTLHDPNFRRTILFLINHDPSEGAMGVILNRPQGSRLHDLEDTLGDPLPQGLGKTEVFEGGPVEKHHLILARMLMADASTSFETLDRAEGGNLLLNPSQGELRAFVGYAGWEKGQLEREIAEKSWIIMPPSPDLLKAVSSPEEGTAQWRAVMRRLGGWNHLMSIAPDDLTLN